MKYFIDTEFYENTPRIDLISVGIVAEDGRTFYAETLTAEYLTKQSEWLTNNVLPLLEGKTMYWKQMQTELISFFRKDENPQFWAWYSAYDWVTFCQIFGGMMNLPANFPMYCNDIRSLLDQYPVSRYDLPVQTTKVHHALNDALWNKEIYEFIVNHNSLDFIEGSRKN